MTPRLKTKAKDHLQCKQRQLVCVHARNESDSMTVLCVQAVNCVRRSHELQQVLSSKVTMLDNLQHILHQIQMAETDVMVTFIYTLLRQNDAVLPV